MIKPSTPFGALVREHRQKKNITQAELATLTGVSRITISNIEIGQGPSLSKAVLLANYLGFSLQIVQDETKE